jgi:hypothetical protein
MYLGIFIPAILIATGIILFCCWRRRKQRRLYKKNMQAANNLHIIGNNYLHSEQLKAPQR